MRRRILTILYTVILTNIIICSADDVLDLKLIKKIPISSELQDTEVIKYDRDGHPKEYYFKDNKCFFINEELDLDNLKNKLFLRIVSWEDGGKEKIDDLKLIEREMLGEDKERLQGVSLKEKKELLSLLVDFEDIDFNSERVIILTCFGYSPFNEGKDFWGKKRLFYQRSIRKIFLYDTKNKVILLQKELPDADKVILNNDKIIVTGKSYGKAYKKPISYFRCLSALDGSLLWESQELSNSSYDVMPESHLIQDNKIFLVTKQHERDEHGQIKMTYSHVWCLSLEDGSVVWKVRGGGGKFLNIYKDTLFIYSPNYYLDGFNINTGKQVYTFDYYRRYENRPGFILKVIGIDGRQSAPIIDPEEGVIYTCYYNRAVVLSLDKPKVVRTYPYRERNSVNENEECKESHKEVNVLFFPLRHPWPSINAPEEEIMEYFRKIELHQYYNINWEGNNLIVRDKYLILRGGIYDKKTGQCIREALIYGDIIFYDDKRIYSLSTLSKEPAIYCYEFIEGKD